MGKKQAKKRSNASGGPEGFEQYYSELYADRWPSLVQALAAEPSYARLATPLTGEYFLDEASVTAARYLDCRPEHRSADLCAVPGGKSLSIFSSWKGLSDAELMSGLDYTMNERSANRRGRMRQVISELLPPAAAEAIVVTGHDAGKWGLYEADSFDRIILDVPCSSERHLVQDPKYLTDWSPSRSTRLSQQAYSFLLSALRSLKSGGELVYSTCALTPEENDRVIERALTRIHKKGEIAVMTANDRKNPDGSMLPDWVEDTALGHIILPDRAQGRGPIFFSRIRRL